MPLHLYIKKSFSDSVLTELTVKCGIICNDKAWSLKVDLVQIFHVCEKRLFFTYHDLGEH